MNQGNTKANKKEQPKVALSDKVTDRERALIDKIEGLVSSIPTHRDISNKGREFIQFRTAFFNNYDFESLRETSRTNKTLQRTGSRSTTWKLLLGVLPVQRNKELWLKETQLGRNRFETIKEKYFSMTKLVQTGQDPLAQMATRSLYSSDDEQKQSPKALDVIKQKMEDQDLISLIQKDVYRTLPEVAFFKNSSVQQQLQQILYMWAKENPDYKYQQGMNDIIATVLVCVLSDTLFRELPSHYHDILDVQDNFSENTKSLNSSQQNQIDAYIVFRELHSPEYIFADAFLMFEKIMDLGIKDLFFKGESLHISEILDSEEEDASTPKTEEAIIDQKRRHKKKLLAFQRVEGTKTALRKRAYKITNFLMKLVDKQLHLHLQRVDFMPELSLLKWLRCLYSREFTLSATLEVWDYFFADIDYQLVQQRKYEHLIKTFNFYQRDDYFTSSQDFLVNMDYLCLAMFQMVRDDLLESDQMGCMEIFMQQGILSSPEGLITIAERIKKVHAEVLKNQEQTKLQEKKPGPSSLLMLKKDKQSGFPKVLEREVQEYNEKQRIKSKLSFERNTQFTSGDFQQRRGLPAKQNKGPSFGSQLVFPVAEASEDAESEQYENMMTPMHYEEPAEVYHSDQLQVFGQFNSSQNFQEETKEHQNNGDTNYYHSLPTPAGVYSTETTELHQIEEEKIEEVYDPPQQRQHAVVYVSPFEKFIAEQQEIYQKNRLRQQLQHNQYETEATTSVTASTQFEQIQQQPSAQVKEREMLQYQLGILDNSEMVNQAILEAEEQIIKDRKKKRQDLAQIKKFLAGMKTKSKKPYQNGQSREQIEQEARRRRGQTRQEAQPGSSWFTRLFW